MQNAEVFKACLEAYRRYKATLGCVKSSAGLKIVGAGRPLARTPHGAGRPREIDFIADFELVGRAALFKAWLAAGQTKRSKGPVRTFNLYYIKRQGRDYEKARAELRCSPVAFEQWEHQVRRVVGGAFRREGLWPLRQYFRRPTGEGRLRDSHPPVGARLDNGFALLGAAYESADLAD